MWWIPLCCLAWELAWWKKRVGDRRRLYEQALRHSRIMGMPLLVIGAPDRGPTRGPGCGDICADIQTSQCPVSIQCDITKRIPLPDNSCVVFVSCVLEYVDDFQGAMRELLRVAQDRIYICRVQPWTFTGMFYPGGKRTLNAKSLRNNLPNWRE